MSSRRAEIRTLLEEWSEAIRRRDIERLMTVYAPDIVYFDIVPPLRFRGLDEVRSNFVRWFDLWTSDIGVELADLTLHQTGEIAAAHMLHRTSGARKAGHVVDYWLRVSLICTPSPAGWAIVHEHVSAPIDFAEGKAVMTLKP